VHVCGVLKPAVAADAGTASVVILPRFLSLVVVTDRVVGDSSTLQQGARAHVAEAQAG
jgi:hypothetical protein